MGDFQANFRRPDTGIHTVEGNVAGSRAGRLEKKRQRDQEQFEQRKKQIEAESRHVSFGSKFSGGSAAPAAERSFKSKTVGLVTAEDFKALSEKAAASGRHWNDCGVDDDDDRAPEREESEREKAARTKAAKKARRKKMKEKKKMLSTLSFAGEEEESDLLHEEGNGGGGGDDDNPGTDPPKSAATSKKDPAVDTSFLPDKERDERAAAERRRLEREWRDRQERIKQEPLEIVYSYWDGSGHRRSVVVTKGDSVGDFLERVRKDLSSEFRELGAVSADALLYVKEDLILPQDLTFYDLIVTRARGKSGPLFHFDVHEDVRIGAVDSRIEKDESHPGKVVERRWYERNRHIFPASRWEVYDPAADYGRYTIHGGEVNQSRKKL